MREHGGQCLNHNRSKLTNQSGLGFLFQWALKRQALFRKNMSACEQFLADTQNKSVNMKRNYNMWILSKILVESSYDTWFPSQATTSNFSFHVDSGGPCGQKVLV